MSKEVKDATPVAEAPVETPVEAPVETNSKGDEKVSGIVTNCLSLAVRSEPAIESKCLVALPVLASVDIDKTKSTDDFYRINTEDGIDGYCKKQFITLK